MPTPQILGMLQPFTYTGSKSDINSFIKNIFILEQF